MAKKVAVAAEGLALSVSASSGAPHHYDLPKGSLPDFAPGRYTPGLGFSIEVWIEDHTHSKTGDILLRTTPHGSIVLNVTGQREGGGSHANPLSLYLTDDQGGTGSDGETANAGIEIDAACSYVHQQPRQNVISRGVSERLLACGCWYYRLLLTAPGVHQLGYDIVYICMVFPVDVLLKTINSNSK